MPELREVVPSKEFSMNCEKINGIDLSVKGETLKLYIGLYKTVKFPPYQGQASPQIICRTFIHPLVLAAISMSDFPLQHTLETN